MSGDERAHVAKPAGHVRLVSSQFVIKGQEHCIAAAEVLDALLANDAAPNHWQEVIYAGDRTRPYFDYDIPDDGTMTRDQTVDAVRAELAAFARAKCGVELPPEAMAVAYRHKPGKHSVHVVIQGYACDHARLGRAVKAYVWGACAADAQVYHSYQRYNMLYSVKQTDPTRAQFLPLTHADDLTAHFATSVHDDDDLEFVDEPASPTLRLRDTVVPDYYPGVAPPLHALAPARVAETAPAPPLMKEEVTILGIYMLAVNLRWTMASTRIKPKPDGNGYIIETIKGGGGRFCPLLNGMHSSQNAVVNIDPLGVAWYRCHDHETCGGKAMRLDELRVEHLAEQITTTEAAREGFKIVPLKYNSEGRLDPLPVHKGGGQQIMILIAPMGAGKSHLIRENVERVHESGAYCGAGDIISYTPRMVYAQSQRSELRPVFPGIVLYSDPRKPRGWESGSVIMQMESAHKACSTHEWTFAYCDEFESVATQLASKKTMRRRLLPNFAQLEHSTRTCHRGYVGDAFLSDRTLNWARATFPLENVTIYEAVGRPPRFRRRAVLLTPPGTIKANLAEDKIFEKACELVDTGKKVYVAMATKKAAEALFARLRDKFPERAPKFLLMTGGVTKTEKARMLDVNAYWQPFQVIIVTTVVTVGCSYTVGDVDCALALFSAHGATPRDMLQALGRPRSLRDEVLYYAVVSKADAGSACGGKSMNPETRSLRQQLAVREEADNYKKRGRDPPQYDESLCALVVHAEGESAAAERHQCLVVLHYLLKAHYTLEVATDVRSKPQVDASQRAFDGIDYYDVVEYIPKAVDDRFGDDEDAQPPLSEEEERAVLQSKLKYYFKRYYSITQEMEVTQRERISAAWSDHCRSEDTNIRKFFSLRHEIHNVPFQTHAVFDNHEQRLNWIRKLTAMLRVDNSLAVGVRIPYKLIQMVDDMVWGLHREIGAAFEIGVNDEKTKSMRGIAFANKVLAIWGHTQLQQGKRTTKRVGGKVVIDYDKAYYELVYTKPHVELFADGAKMARPQCSFVDDPDDPFG